VQHEWLRRVEAEYRSAAVTQHLTLWLIQIGAAPDLIEDGLRIVQDELAHAEMSHAVFVAAGGREAPCIDRDALALRRDTAVSLEEDVLRAGLELFCLGETLAVPLFKELRAGCTEPTAKAALNRVLKDEVRHRDFGWALLDWLLQTPLAPQLRARAQAELPRLLERLARGYAPPGAEKDTSMADEDRAWGLMPPAEYAAVHARALVRDLTPRFARLGLSMPTT
jgi:hypothetical protein